MTKPAAQPTAGAKRCALAIARANFPRYAIDGDERVVEILANTVDRETHLPELIAALELCLEDAERQSRADAPGVEPDWADDVRAALAAASIKPEGT